MKQKSMVLIREAMMHFLYAHFLLHSTLEDSQLKLRKDIDFNDYQFQKLTNILEVLFPILDIIKASINVNWSFDRLSCIDKAILVIATYEIIYEKLDYPITVNEAIKISKKYGNSTDYKYINAVLETINAKNLVV